MAEATRTYSVTFTTVFDFQVEVPMNMTDERQIADIAYNQFTNLPPAEQMDYVIEALETDDVVNEDSIEDIE